MTSGRLRAFYEDPAVPASSGPDRARRQADMLAEVLAGVQPPARIIDVGCGDGFATHVAAQRNAGHASPGSTGPRARLRPRDSAGSQ